MFCSDEDLSVIFAEGVLGEGKRHIKTVGPETSYCRHFGRGCGVTGRRLQLPGCIVLGQGESVYCSEPNNGSPTTV